MGFKANQAEANQGGIKPEGDYECVIAKCEERTTKNGKTGLNFTLVVRNDVNQKYQNACIFHTLWKRREPTEADMQVNGYGFGQVMALGKAAGLPDGKDYDSLEQFIGDLMNKPVKATLYHEEWNGKIRERVSWLNQTQFPTVAHKPKQKSNGGASYASAPSYPSAGQSVSDYPSADLPADDDLPF